MATEKGVSRKRRPKTKDLEKEDPLENEDLEKEDPLENEEFENEDPLENEDLENEDPLENEDLENEDPLENEDLENEDPLEKHENKKWSRNRVWLTCKFPRWPKHGLAFYPLHYKYRFSSPINERKISRNIIVHVI